MPRTARVVFPGVPHHVTQRGNRRQPTFFGASDYVTYLRIAAGAFTEARVQVWAYCLMPNHVHLIATPETEAGLAQAVSATHVRYARHINRRESWTGCLWQGRFASAPMDEAHLSLCARYVGLNPVRAGLTRRAVDWPWSSVRAHLSGEVDPLLTPEPLSDLLGPHMATFFDLDAPAEQCDLLRGGTRTGRPLGSTAWQRSKWGTDTHPAAQPN
ncbi:transposase [Caulobacter sp. Root656]|nr:transposase [Caulobacter sp. Root656]